MPFTKISSISLNQYEKVRNPIESGGNAADLYDLTPDCVYSGYLRLLAAILKIAVSDWKNLEGSDESFCDRGHASLCKKQIFDDGKRELKIFFESEWFERICLELSLDPETVHELTGLED